MDDLRKVKGVGPATLERLRPLVQAGGGGSEENEPPAAARPAGKPPLDVNRASAAELEQLDGIGPKRAQRIIEERAKRPFASVDELRRVYGIGPKILERLRPQVTVGKEPPAHATTEKRH